MNLKHSDFLGIQINLIRRFFFAPASLRLLFCVLAILLEGASVSLANNTINIYNVGTITAKFTLMSVTGGHNIFGSLAPGQSATTILNGDDPPGIFEYVLFSDENNHQITMTPSQLLGGDATLNYYFALPPLIDDKSDGGGCSSSGCTSCSGMPVWSVSEPYISLWLHDEPLGYHPVTGPAVSLRLDFKQRETVVQVNTNFFGVGKLWNCDWFSYVGLGIVMNGTNLGNIVYFPDGKQRLFCATNDYLTNAKLSGNATNGFTLTYPNGSQDIYGFIVTNTGGVFQEAFLSQRKNSQGQATILNYYGYNPMMPVIRLQNVVDGDGRTNLIYYNNTNPYSTNLICQVTDPFGRSAYLYYNTNGNLTNITDVAYNSSSLTYDTNNWVNSLATPYGITSFTVTDTVGTNVAPNGRSVLVTEPDGGHQLYLFKNSAPGIFSSYGPGQFPNTGTFVNNIQNTNLDLNDTFYWGARQYVALSTTNIAAFTTNDFCKAQMQHWLTRDGNLSAVSSTLSVTREPSPDAAGNIAGQTTWYDYVKVRSGNEGDQIQPLFIARVLPDGTTAFNYNIRNSYGSITTNISTYSTGANVLFRTNISTYATDDINLLTTTNALKVLVVKNIYNGNHEIVTNYNAMNEITVNTYDSSQRLTSTTLPDGLVVTNLYNLNGYLSQQIAVGFQTNSYTYTNGLVYTHTDKRGLTTTNNWDYLNRLVGTSFPDGSTISNQYTYLDLTATKDRMGNWTHFAYDGLRRMIAQTNALNYVTIYNYCTCGSLESVLDAGNNLTRFEYDNQGNRTDIYYPDNYSVATTYNLLGQVVNTADSSGDSVTNLYNNQGLLLSAANAIGVLVTNSYDILDRTTNSVDANNVSINTTYDKLNRPLTRSYPDGGVEKWAYTTNFPSATAYTNQITNVVLYAYDPLNRKTNEVFVGVTTNRFAFSGAGDLLKLTDGKSQTTTWGYDVYGRVTNKLDALGTNLFRYQYDVDNRLTNRWSVAKGNTVYRYDPLGNLTNVDYSGGSTAMTNVSLAYDTLNRLTNMVDAVGTTVYAYDAVGQLLSEAGLWANDTVNYTYQNRLRTGLSLAQPNTSPWNQSYDYDNARRLVALTSPAGEFDYTYDLVRKTQVNGLYLPNSAYITNSFDVVARLVGATLAANTGMSLDSYSYGYNQAGQRTNVVRTAGDSVGYTYDYMGQLLTANGKEAGGVTNRWQEQFGYAYDAAGNLNSRTNNKLVQTFKLNALNELTNVTRSGTLTVAGTTTTAATNVTVNTSNAVRYADFTFAATNFTLANGANMFTAIAKDNLGNKDTNVVTANLLATNNYVYDLNGNLRTNSNQVLDYDNENQLIQVTVTNAWKDEFVYDGKFRRRIERDYTWSGSAWLQTNETHFIYDGNVVIEERNSNNVPLVTYTRGKDLSSSLQGAGGIGGLLARSDHSQPPTPYYSVHSYYHADGNGNVTMLINASQTMVAKYLYDPFGNMLSMSGPLAPLNTYRFSSKEWNNNVGYYYYLYRYYDPNLQRWLNEDPIQEFGGFNLYKFDANNSIGYIDTNGKFVVFFIVAAVAVAVEVATIYYQINSIQSQSQANTTDTSDPKQLDNLTQSTALNILNNIPPLAQNMTYTLSAPESGITPLGFPSGDLGDAAVSAVNGAVQSSDDITSLYERLKNELDNWRKKKNFPKNNVWECKDKTGYYLKSSPTSPGPAWKLVGTTSNQ